MGGYPLLNWHVVLGWVVAIASALLSAGYRIHAAESRERDRAVPGPEPVSVP